VIVVSELVSAIENEFKRQDVHRLKTTRLEFISNIIAALARTKRISATSLTYLETFFLTLGKRASLEADALAAMSVVINLRSLLFDFIRDSVVDSEVADCVCQAIEIHYERSYSEPDSVELAEILGELVNDSPKTFVVSRFARGSTLIELVAMQVVSVGAVLTALNFVLRQLNTTLVRAQEVRKNAVKLLSPPSRGAKKRGKKPASGRISALQRPESLKESSSLHQTVAAHGYQAVLLDDEAKTTVHYLSNK
jgi:ribosomal protein L17